MLCITAITAAISTTIAGTTSFAVDLSCPSGCTAFASSSSGTQGFHRLLHLRALPASAFGLSLSPRLLARLPLRRSLSPLPRLPVSALAAAFVDASTSLLSMDLLVACAAFFFDLRAEEGMGFLYPGARLTRVPG